MPAWVLERLAGGPFARFEKREERWHLTAHGRVPPGVFAFYEHVRNVGSPNGASWWVGSARYYASLVAVPDGTGPVSWVIDKVGRRRGRKR